MSNPHQSLATHDKALRINLDPQRYGSFAEIGAGQEVVRWFFHVGGAAGTISKSISAYDMTVSDSIYGRADRYVSRSRLESMLAHEHDLNRQRLAAARGSTTAFFAFADTVVARSFRGNNECHGWMGVRFQARPNDGDSQIVIHVRLRDRTNPAQQEALGIVGVNLLHGAFFQFGEPERLIESLCDGLSTDRIEIDMIEFSGSAFDRVDNRLMSMKLVELGLSGAAMFAPDGHVLQPSEVLRKKRVLVQRGSFRPLCYSHLDIERTARERFAPEPGEDAEIVELMELTMQNLRDGGKVDRSDFLARADMLCAAGKTVLISDYFEFHRLASYIEQHTQERIAMAIGVPTLAEIFDEARFRPLPGGILESLGRLFRDGLELYVYPFLDPATGALVNAESFAIPEHLAKLYGHLLDSGAIKKLENFDSRCLPIFSRDALAKIRSGDPSWENMVPPEVAALIKARGLLDYRAPGARAA